MVKLSDKDLSIIKKLELDISIEIKRICEAHDIKYSIAFGTLLGAVRHGGFIPWDDDIDIVMLRSEYDRFLLYADKEMDKRYEIVNYETNSYMGEPFTKIMLKDTVMLENFAEHANAPCGVFVDIFPADVCPESWMDKNIHRFLNYELRKRILLASNYNFRKNGMKKLVYDLLKMTAISKRSLVKKYRHNERKYQNSNSQSVVFLGGNYGYIKDTVPRHWFDDFISIDFEGVRFSAFACTEDFLKHYYGDYMQLPPEEKRVNKHSVAKLDLTLYGGRKAE